MTGRRAAAAALGVATLGLPVVRAPASGKLGADAGHARSTVGVVPAERGPRMRIMKAPLRARRSTRVGRAIGPSAARVRALHVTQVAKVHVTESIA